MGVGPINPQIPQPSLQGMASPSVARHLQTPAMQSVLKGLGISADRVATITTQRGNAAGTAGLESMQLVPVTPDRAAVLMALGLGNVDLVISLQAQDEIRKIRKSLVDILESILGKEAMASLLSALGLDPNDETLIYADDQGGLLIVQSALKELEDSIDDR